MVLQRFDGMDVDTEVVLMALCFRFSVVNGSDGWMCEVLGRAYDDYHDAQSTKESEKIRWVLRAVEIYEEEGELPTFAMRLGTEWIKEGNKHAFIGWLHERSKRMEKQADKKTSQRILQRQVSEDGGSGDLSFREVRSAK